MTRVSVIIPSYNSGSFLETSVRSVLAQTMQDLELIVVDDGSRKPQTEIMELDARIRFHAQLNRGVSVARNVGASLARGEFIAFLDHDDEWEPRKLELQLQSVESEPEAAFWCTAFTWVRDGHEQASDPTRLTYHGLLSTQHALLSSALIRADDYRAVGGHDPLLAQMQDWELLLRLAMSGRSISMRHERLVRYNLHEQNASRDYQRAAAERFSIIADHERAARSRADAATLRAVSISRKRTRELFAFQAVDVARSEARLRHPRRALDHLAFALRLDSRVVAKSALSFGTARLSRSR